MKSRQGSEKQKGQKWSRERLSLWISASQHSWGSATLFEPERCGPALLSLFHINPSGHQWKGKMKIPLKVLAQREEITKADWRNKSGMSKEEAGLLQQQNIFASLWLHLIYLGSILARCYTHSNTEATVGKEKLPFDRKKPWAELCSKDGVPSPRGQLRWIIKGVRHCCSFFFFQKKKSYYLQLHS